MKRPFTSNNSFLIVLTVLFLQSFLGCKNNTNSRTNETSLPSTIVVLNHQSEPLVVWLSKDSVALHYFFGAAKGEVSIMHVVYDGAYTSINPLFVIPYTNFVKIVDPGDSLIIISKDSAIRNDIQISLCSSLNFIDEKELLVLKQLGYQEKVVLTSGLNIVKASAIQSIEQRYESSAVQDAIRKEVKSEFRNTGKSLGKTTKRQLNETVSNRIETHEEVDKVIANSATKTVDETQKQAIGWGMDKLTNWAYEKIQ